MKDLVDAVRAADSVWPVLAILLLGLYVLLWRFGDKILWSLAQNHEEASGARQEVSDLQLALTTESGDHLGQSLDKLTKIVTDHIATSELNQHHTGEEVRLLRREVALQTMAATANQAKVQAQFVDVSHKLTKLDDRVSGLETEVRHAGK